VGSRAGGSRRDRVRSVLFGRSTAVADIGGPMVLDRIDDVLLLSDGRRVGYRIRGDRTSLPIVYFHGQPGSRLEAELLPDDRIQAAGVCMVSFDRPGMGLSDLIPARDMTLDVQDAVHLADHLGIRRFAVIGVSAGGPPALAISATHPDRVIRTVLCSASGPSDDEAYLTDEDADDVRRLRESGAEAELPAYDLERGEMLRDMSGVLAGWFADFPEAERTWITTSPAGAAFIADVSEAVRQGARGWLRESEVRAMPWSFDPATIATPVRAFHGEDDTWELVSNIRRIVERIPDTKLTVHAGGNHLSPLMHPEDVLAAAGGRVSRPTRRR
jgi:pimeloyl-ACP methyl ester carboxylesterase